jgi:hypothetical protein
VSKVKHTPGPWRIVIDDDGNPLSGRPMVAPAPELDCAIVHWDGFKQTFWESARGEKEMHANARLIAAAPDLLEALEWYRDQMCEGFCVDLKSEEEYYESMDFHCAGCKARTAIAKAKGSDK